MEVYQLRLGVMGKSLLGILLILICSIQQCHNSATVHCAHIGQVKTDEFIWDLRVKGKVQNTNSSDYRYNYYSIGAELFSNQYQKALDPAYAHIQGASALPIPPDSSECYFEITNDADWRDLQLCVNKTQVHLRTYYVRQGGRILKGWLHFEFELVDPTDKIVWIYMQVIDDNFNAVGEFVHEDYNDKMEQHCGPTKDYLAHPTIYQHLPCTATGLREPKNSQALFMVQPKYLFKNSSAKYLQKENLDKGFHVTWRFGENWCSRHYMMRPDIFILTEKNKENYVNYVNQNPQLQYPGNDNHRVYRKAGDYWLIHEWFGSWDVQAKSKGTLECDGGEGDKYLVMNNDKVNLVEDGWIRGKLKYTKGNDYYSSKHEVNLGDNQIGFKSCQTNPFDPKYKESVAKVSKFGGRCASLNDKIPPPTKEQFQDCKRNKSAPEFQSMQGWRNYSEYVQNLTKARNETCDPSYCRPPINETDKVKILAYPPGFITKSQAENSSIFALRPQTTFKRFWRGRKFHGIMCIISAMFVTPISIFVARYYKETFMDCECVGAKAWYWVHIGTSVANIALYFTSQTAIAPSIQTMGNNIDGGGIIHRYLGWISHSLFLILVILGGFRVGPNANQKRIRRISIVSHSVVGFLQYFLNVILIFQSSWIPGSPSISVCGDDGLPNDFSPIAGVALAWMAIEICSHTAVTTLQLMTDNNEVYRGGYCILIPVMSPSSHSDLVGSPLRKVLLPIYAGVCGVITFTAVMIVSLNELPVKCGFGQMSCEDQLGCSPYAKAMREKFDKAANASLP